MENDTFQVPSGGALQFNCATDGSFLGGYGDDYSGADGSSRARNEEEEYYFN